MIVYQTDDEGYFVGVTQADPDPKNAGGWLIPRGCVTTSPPAVGGNQAAKWDGSAWVLLPDLRGQKYWLADGSEHEITTRGIPLPPNAMSAKPPKPLAEVKAAKLAALDADRKRIETMPISGNQGGKLFSIARPEKLQEFLMGGLSIALDPSPAASFSMLDDNGVEVTYSKTLMGQIISFINASKQPALKRYDARKAAIETARDAAELAAIDTDLTRP